MDLKDYKIKNTTKCECGYEFTIHNMKKLQRIPDNNFYGGVVKHIDEITCPNCEKDTLLFLKQTGQTYIVKDIAQKDTLVIEANEEITENDTNTLEETSTIATEASTIENSEKTTTNNEIICPVCERSFKNKSGLTIHMKTHQNK